MANDHTAHKLFKGPDLEALKPWLTAYTERSRALNATCSRAINVRDNLPSAEQVIISHLIGRPVPINYDPVLELCPENMLMLPSLLRDTADMIDDLIKKVGIEPAPAWTPTKES